MPILDQMARHVWGMFAPRIRPGSVPPPDEDVPLWRDEMETLAGMVRAAVPAPPTGQTTTYPRPQPMPDAEMPDREWTDYEWVLNQWWLANQHCEMLEERLAEKAAISPGAPPAGRRAPTKAMIDAAYVAMWGKAPEYEAPMVIAERTHRVHDVLRAALAAQQETSPGITVSGGRPSSAPASVPPTVAPEGS